MTNPSYLLQELALPAQIQDIFLIRDLKKDLTKNGKPYAKLVLSDKSMSLNVKVWDLTDETYQLLSDCIAAGYGLFEVHITKDSQYGLQGVLHSAAVVEEVPQDRITQLLPETSGLPTPEEMMEKLLKAADRIQHPELKAVTRYLLDKYRDAFMYMPAAMKVHHEFRGGLGYHVLRMTRMAARYSMTYPEANADLVLAGVLVHDIGKIEEYSRNHLGLLNDYSRQGRLMSHNLLGIEMLKEACDACQVSDEVYLLLSHIIESHHGKPEWGSSVPPKFLEAEIVHLIDMIDARTMTYSSVLKDLEPGQFSKRITSLTHEVYKPDL